MVCSIVNLRITLKDSKNLFNIVFGNLSANDVNLFLDVSGIPGLNLSILYEIATNGFVNYPDLLKRLDMRSTGPIREKIILLSSIGFLNRPRKGASMYQISHKGRVFLEVIRRLLKELNEGSISSELNFILNKCWRSTSLAGYSSISLTAFYA